MPRIKHFQWLATVALVGLISIPLRAQNVPWTPLARGSDNIEVLGHLPLGHRLSIADMDIEQELERP